MPWSATALPELQALASSDMSAGMRSATAPRRPLTTSPRSMMPPRSSALEVIVESFLAIAGVDAGRASPPVSRTVYILSPFLVGRIVGVQDLTARAGTGAPCHGHLVPSGVGADVAVAFVIRPKGDGSQQHAAAPVGVALRWQEPSLHRAVIRYDSQQVVGVVLVNHPQSLAHNLEDDFRFIGPEDEPSQRIGQGDILAHD